LFVWGEITVGVLLIAGAATRGSALVSSIMLVAFEIAVVSAMARGLKIDCGCFTGAKAAAAKSVTEVVGWPKVFEDLGYLAMSIFLIYFPHSFYSVDRVLRNEGREALAAPATREL
jgi:uncharacterized membrane protein YphA (DoxX/SURF4 family)